MTKPNSKGQYRVFGHGSPLRVWIGVPATPGPVTPDTLMKLTDAHGNTATVRAVEIQFDYILNH